MTGRLNRQYETRMRRAVNQQKAQLESVEVSQIVAVTALQDDVSDIQTNVTDIEGDITTITTDIVTLQADVAAITAGTVSTDTLVDTSGSATAWFTYYPQTTGALGSGISLPAMTDVLPGKMIMYTLVTDGGGNLTVSGTMKYQAATYTSAVFNDAGDTMMLVSADNNGTLEWHIISYTGVSLS